MFSDEDSRPGSLLLRLPGYLLRGLGAVVLLVFAGWSELAILLNSPLESGARVGVATLVAAVFLAGSMSVLAKVLRRLVLPLVVVTAVGVIAWWSSIQPSDTRNWRPDVARKPLVTIKGDDLELRNVRVFNWTGPESAQVAWQDRIYNLSDLSGVDLFLSDWGNPKAVHMITSFTFSAGPPVAFSVEVRRKLGQEYSPIAGLFKQNELVLVVADESDVIKVRTNRRDERVFRYPIDVKPENAAKLLREYARLSQDLNTTPQWYHTIWTNCATTVYWMLRRIAPDDFPLDWRVLVAPYLPDYLYDRGFLNTKVPLQELKRRAEITAAARAADGEQDFSAAIRK